MISYTGVQYIYLYWPVHCPFTDIIPFFAQKKRLSYDNIDFLIHNGAQVFLVSPFFQLFIVLGMYNFAFDITSQNNYRLG